MSTDIIETRVEAGAAWLDEHLPEWVDLVDTDRLNLGSSCNCILGQLAGFGLSDSTTLPTYEHVVGYDLDPGLAILFQIDQAMPVHQARELGFTMPDDETYISWTDLTEAWRVVIDRRRNQR